MPTYDYACAACGHRFERFESIRESGVKACAKCGKRKAKRMLGTGAGLIFKGSGFYTTDYRPPAPSSSGEGAGSEGSGDADKSKKKPGDADKKKSQDKGKKKESE